MTFNLIILMLTHCVSALLLFKAGHQLRTGPVSSMFYFLFMAEVVNIACELFHLYYTHTLTETYNAVNFMHTIYSGLILIASIHAANFSKLMCRYKINNKPDG